MFKNSSELLDCALREFQAAIDGGKSEVKIVVQEWFSGDFDEMKKLGDDLEIKEIVELLREEFSGYNIKSRLEKSHLSGVITFKDAPCSLMYELVWKNVLTKKH